MRLCMSEDGVRESVCIVYKCIFYIWCNTGAGTVCFSSLLLFLSL